MEKSMEEQKPNEFELDELRREIAAVDGEFIRLLARRQDLSRRIADHKMSRRIPLRNYSVERRVIARFEVLSRESGLDERWGAELADFLIERSVELQSTMLERRYSGGRQRVLVVGGLGKMGRWISSFLHNQGHEVCVFDVEGGESAFPRAHDLTNAVAAAEMIILSVPLSESPATLERIIDLAPAGVICDLCSIKRRLVPLLEAGIARGLRITSIHPLFGPEVRTLHGRNIVVCSAGCTEADDAVRDLFAETAASLIDLTPGEHDRLMSMTLGLSHALNLAFARALAGQGESAERLRSVASSTFSRQLGTALEVTGEHMDLYYEIQRLCDSEAVYGALGSAVESLREMIENGRRVDFVRAMEDVARFFECNSRQETEREGKDGRAAVR
jgi:chorismate mutase / prephenate dehydrogenase